MNKLFDWIGGKKWLSSKLENRCEEILKKNSNIEYYIEPFCGSMGSVIASIDVFKKFGIKKILLNDINTNLINVYLMVKNKPNELYELIKNLEENHISLIPEVSFTLNKTKDKLELKELMREANNYYNNIRSQYNKLKNSTLEDEILLSSAQFLFLMYRAFNGVYRENKKGEFNTPYGWTNKRINLENKYENIMNFHNLFKEMDIVFYNMDFNDFLEKCLKQQEKCLFYFDPPYLNVSLKENDYNKEIFGLNEQKILLDYVDKFDNIIYSNHNLELFNNFFNKEKYTIEVVKRKNNMSSDNSTRINDAEEIFVFS
jgi:DNA adenine methylase